MSGPKSMAFRGRKRSPQAMASEDPEESIFERVFAILSYTTYDKLAGDILGKFKDLQINIKDTGQHVRLAGSWSAINAAHGIIENFRAKGPSGGPSRPDALGLPKDTAAKADLPLTNGNIRKREARPDKDAEESDAGSSTTRHSNAKGTYEAGESDKESERRGETWNDSRKHGTDAEHAPIMLAVGGGPLSQTPALRGRSSDDADIPGSRALPNADDQQYYSLQLSVGPGVRKEQAPPRQSGPKMELPIYDWVVWLWVKVKYQPAIDRLKTKWKVKLTEEPNGSRSILVITYMDALKGSQKTALLSFTKELKSYLDTAEHKGITGMEVPMEFVSIPLDKEYKNTFVCDGLNGKAYIVGINDKHVKDLNKKLASTNLDASARFLETSNSTLGAGHMSLSHVDMSKENPCERSVMIDQDVLTYIAKVSPEMIKSLEGAFKVSIGTHKNDELPNLKFRGLKSNVVLAMDKFASIVETLQSNLCSDEVCTKATWVESGIWIKTLDDIKNENSKIIFEMQDKSIKMIGPKAAVYRAKTRILEVLGMKRVRKLVTGESKSTCTPPSDAKPISTTSTDVALNPAAKSFSWGRTEENGMHFGNGSAPTSQVSSISPEGVTYRTKTGTYIHIFCGDITTLLTTAVVNAANDRLIHGAGVARAISKAAGQDLQRACTEAVRRHGSLLLAEPYTTKGFRMKCTFVIHIVGPEWQHYVDKPQCAAQLQATFTNCLKEADRKYCSSVAIPAVSSGVFGVPPDVVAEQLFHAAVNYANGGSCYIKDILLVDINKDIISIVQRLFSQEAERSDYVRKVEADFERFLTAPLPVSQASVSRRPASTIGSGADAAGHYNSMGLHGDVRAKDTDTRPKRPVSTTAVSTGRPGRADRKHTTEQTIDKSPMVNSQDTSLAIYQNSSRPDGEDGESCSVCMTTPTNPKTLKCKHVFCSDCIEQWFKSKPTCPVCGMAFGEMKGNQPIGTMKPQKIYTETLPGFESAAGIIEITYHFRNGTQKEDHPNPGQSYNGTTRVAYLPNNTEGRKVLELLERAFKAKLLFTIGRSVTTGKDDVVTWNDVHHKTSKIGGAFGYPDSTYLSRVQEELGAKGIK